MKHYFITGATGAIGAALIPILLEDRNISVDLLIRAESEIHLEKRLKKLFEFWEFNSDDEKKQRIHGVTGDISLPAFGIEDKEFHTILKKCTHIIHCAGNVRMNLPMEEARRCSVDSAKNVVGLAEACLKNNNLEKVEFVSTVGVGGRMPGSVPETWIDIERDFHNTYEKAKAEAEGYIRAQIDRGLPITVHRPSMVVGDSKTGKIIHFQIFYHICKFLSGKRTLGVTPDTGNASLDIIPCDYVANVIVWSSKNRKTIGHVIHECSGSNHSILISDLKKHIQKHEFKATTSRTFTVPVWVFKAALPMIVFFVSSKAKRAIKNLPIFFDYLAEHQEFENIKTKEVLNNAVTFYSYRSFLNQVLKYFYQK